MLYDATEKDEIAKLIIEKKPELSDNNVFNLLYYATNIEKIKELLGKDNINKLSDNNVYGLLDAATKKDKIAELLGKDNINKLSDQNVYDLLKHATNKEKIAEIINKYHTKKTPEIQEMLDKYLHEL